MARGIRKITNSNIGISITGIAGPASDNSEKPAGLVYIGLSSEDAENTFEFRFTGARSRIRTSAAGNALDIIRKMLLQV
jgi:PncC family amidohydrolase